MKTKLFLLLQHYGQLTQAALLRVLIVWLKLWTRAMSTSTRWRFAGGWNLERSCLIVPRMATCVWRISANCCFCCLSSEATSSCKSSSCRQKKSVALQLESHLSNLTIHGILRQVSRTERSCSRRVFRPLEMRLLSRSNTWVVVTTHLFCGAMTADRHCLLLTPQELPQAQCHKQLSCCTFCEPKRYDIFLHSYHNTS